MSMVCLIYASRFSRGVGPNDVPDILSVSEEQNKEAGITGVLCYDPRFFLQVIEGPRANVNELYCKIAGDKRHAAVTLLAYHDMEERLFADWSMAYVRIDDTTKTLCQKYCVSGRFDPYAMTAEQALGFVVEVSEQRRFSLDSLAGE